MAQVGSSERPLRVAVVGSGPSGFYAAGALLSSPHVVHVDLLDRLPTPFGLVRGGVAPDHQKIKSVVKAYDRTAKLPGFRFLGNVAVGRDVSLGSLLESYDQVVLAVGCEGSNELGIEGEDLDGSHSATDFVGWYNGHPDHQGHAFDLSVSAAVVVGVGNVAMDVTRVLLRDPDQLASTDITDRAVRALRESRITDVYVLGRRGCAQAAFSPAEIKEIAELDGVDLVVRPQDAELDPLSAAWLEEHGDKQARQNVEFLQQIAGREPTAPRRVHLRLLTSPIRYLGDGHVQHVEVGYNQLVDRGGRIGCSDTGERARIDAGIVFRAVGYRGVPLPGAPFDDRRGIIPNREGRVVDGEQVVPRLYVVGWAKRGPSGLIGTNRADAKATVDVMLADVPDLDPADSAPIAALDALAVTWEDWGRIDAAEVERGSRSGKLREKFVQIPAMLTALGRDEG